MDQPADAEAVMCDLIEEWAKDRRPPATVQLENVRGEWAEPVHEFLRRFGRNGRQLPRIYRNGVEEITGEDVSDLRKRGKRATGASWTTTKIDAYGTAPAWLLQHAHDTAQRLHDAGEPVTPDAVAEQMRLSFNPEQMRLSVKDTLDAARWAFRLRRRPGRRGRRRMTDDDPLTAYVAALEELVTAGAEVGARVQRVDRQSPRVGRRPDIRCRPRAGASTGGRNRPVPTTQR